MFLGQVPLPLLSLSFLLCNERTLTLTYKAAAWGVGSPLCRVAYELAVPGVSWLNSKP